MEANYYSFSFGSSSTPLTKDSEQISDHLEVPLGLFGDNEVYLVHHITSFTQWRMGKAELHRAYQRGLRSSSTRVITILGSKSNR